MSKYAKQIKLKEIREARGITQRQMADLIGITEQTFSKKELGKNEFTFAEAKIISQHLGKRITEVFI